MIGYLRGEGFVGVASEQLDPGRLWRVREEIQ
jgi:hypothetical protein